MKALVLSFLLIATAMFAVAADVDGKWTGSLSTPGGDFPVNFTFKADGAKLTGSLEGMDGMQVPLKDGKIDGANISFVIDLDFGGMPFTISYKGVVSAAEIKFTADAAGMPLEFVVKKAK